MFDRKTIRLQQYDYTKSAYYFVTINAWKWLHLFGEIRDHKMVLNESGIILMNDWLQLPQIRPNVHLDEFVVMPNHFHAIIQIGDDPFREHGPRDRDRGEKGGASPAPTADRAMRSANAPLAVRAMLASPPRLAPNSLGSIIGGFKSGVTRKIRLVNSHLYYIWHHRYYERIIRDEQDLNRTRNYIRENPANWERDKRGNA